MYNNFNDNNNNNNGYNEFSFYPENNNQKDSGKGVVILLTIFMTLVAMATISVMAYTLIKGGSSSNNQPTGGTPSAQQNEIASNGNGNGVIRDNIPTIIQLSTPKDALTIPQVVEKVSPSVVGISCVTTQGMVTGTGIILSEDGYIITNAHVVEGGSDFKVVLDKSLASETHGAQLIGADTQTDLAVLKIEKTGLPAAEFGTSGEMVVGEAAIVIGNPLGFELAGSVTAGIVSALDRKLTVEDREMNLIQTDASINSGNSGGPLINAYGQVVGITSVKINSTYGEGLGFAIPIDDAMPIIEDLLKYGYVKGRPQLGIMGENVTEIYSQYYNIPQGFIVRGVNENSAAEKAGIKVDDIVIGINGQLITTIEEFNSIKANYKAGEEITISVYRDGEIIDFDVTLDEAFG